MDLEAELDQVFQVSLGEFTEARNALAARLRAADPGAADRVKSLAKPAASAWAVNQLGFRAPDLLSALVAAGARLRAAQQGVLAASELREAMRVWRGALNAAVKQAESYLGKGERGASPAVLQRIERTLQAVGLREAGNEEPGPGRLTADLDPPGFDALAGLLASPAAASAPSTPDAATSDTEVDDARRRFELARAEAEASRRRRRADEAEAEMAAAERRLEGSRAELAEAERRLGHARELVAREQEGLSRARSQRDEAEAALADAEAALGAARRSLDEGS